ncbi:MAG: MBL fold metallo-hydrolase [Candidatus Bathyarchaeota archaeon]|nr:MAG: MBL fold metallo-hydrolase [Candidatus Bathyarchaeota archaeon]
MRLDKISERVYVNCEGKTGGNVGVIATDGAAYAVDSQFPAPARDFRASIPTVTGSPVTHLILTHMHSDHVLGSQAFDDCEIVAQAKVMEKMEQKLGEEWAQGNLEETLRQIRESRPQMAPLYEGLRIVLPTETFRERYELDGVEVVNTGGHTDCSSIVHVWGDATIFAGDLIVPGMFPYAGDPTSDPVAWIGAFKTMLELDPETIVPGHGGPCGAEEVETQLAYFEATRATMLELIAGGATQQETIDHDGYPEFYQSTGGEKELYMRALYRVLSDEN